MSNRSVFNARLSYMAQYVEKVVPDYDIKQSNPLLAASEGIGNCVAKAVIAGVLLERNNFLGGTKPALAWNKNTHPRKYEDLLGRVSLRNGHALLLATNNSASIPISYLAFNPMGTEADDWETDEFNDIDIHATVENHVIVPTQQGLAAGYVIEDWYEGGKKYIEALGIQESVYHSVPRDEIVQKVIESLIDRSLLSDFDTK